MTALLVAFRPLILLSAACLLILNLSRLSLLYIYKERVMAVDGMSLVIFQGLRFDLVLVGLLIIIPTLVSPFFITHKLGLSLWKNLITVWVTLLTIVVLFMELSTFHFIEQFDVRPNILFFEYANHPKEILAMLWAAYKLPLAFALCITFGVGFFVYRKCRILLTAATCVSWRMAIPCALIFAIFCGAMIRSTTDHRPVNPSVVAQTTDTLVNDLPLSSTYTVGFAAYAMKDEEAGVLTYGHIDSGEATSIVRDSMAINDDLFIDDHTTNYVALANTRTSRPKNLVIILQESMGAEFVGALGGIGVTPNIDTLSTEGMWFEKLYATGTRSVRGIEAVMTGFPPTPARSVVKLNKSQSRFFTIATALKEYGYDTSFIYGGESHFDNMRRFFIGNGIDRIIDENDYDNPIFTGSWGVSDEDLMFRAHKEFEAMGDKPFFSLVFSSSNHTPFEFPDDRIALYDDEKQTVNNAVKYADYAIGEFFKLAKQSNYWKDTLFLIVADHNSRVYGNTLIPIHRFHIPGLILGDGIEPSVYSKIASQIDLAPTLLSLMGIDTVLPMPGRDLIKLDNKVPGRAVMQFNAINAYMEEDKVAILRRNIAAETYIYHQGKLEKTVNDNELQNKALAMVTWASQTYQNRGYSGLSNDKDYEGTQ